MSIPVEKLLCETRRVFQALAEAADEGLVACGISHCERALLEAVAKASSPVTVAALARETLTPLKETCMCLAALRERGWVECVGELSDSPDAAVVLSPQGRARRVELRASERDLLNRISAGLDEKAIHSTFATLRSVRRLLRSPPEPTTQRRHCLSSAGSH